MYGRFWWLQTKGINKAGLLERIEQSLQTVKLEFEVFDEVAPNPKDSTILKGAQRFIDAKAQAVFGLGGGSPMDAAKAISVMSANEGSIEAHWNGVNLWPNPPKPIVAVPTTSGTGAEVSAAAMINVSDKNRKMSMVGPSIRPEVAVVDPMLNVGLPPRLTTLTGIDMLSHAVEAYIAKNANPMSDLIAKRANELAVGNPKLAYQDGHNLKARSHMMLASTIAVIAASNFGLGVIHALGG